MVEPNDLVWIPPSAPSGLRSKGGAEGAARPPPPIPPGAVWREPGEQWVRLEMNNERHSAMAVLSLIAKAHLKGPKEAMAALENALRIFDPSVELVSRYPDPRSHRELLRVAEDFRGTSLPPILEKLDAFEGRVLVVFLNMYMKICTSKKGPNSVVEDYEEEKTSAIVNNIQKAMKHQEDVEGAMTALKAIIEDCRLDVTLPAVKCTGDFRNACKELARKLRRKERTDSSQYSA